MEGVGPVLAQEPHPPPSCWSRQPLRPQACPVSEMGLSHSLHTSFTAMLALLTPTTYPDTRYL